MQMKKSGIILFDKQEGITSQTAVTRVKRLLGVKTAGHTGTLDPIATGLMIICYGRATRASQYLIGCDKSYRAVLKTGIETDTCDITGEVIKTTDKRPTADEIKSLLPAFYGRQLQRPPSYSAIRINGKHAYELARKGESVKPDKREIFIFSIELISADEAEGLFTIDISCSKGTYIRSLCRDIGKAAGSGGTMAALQRTSVGKYGSDEMINQERMERMIKACDFSFIYDVDTVFSDLPKISVDNGAFLMIKNGVDIPDSKIAQGTAQKPGRYRVYSQYGEFIAVCNYDGKKLTCEKSFYEV